MAWLGEPLKDKNAREGFSPRCVKDVLEERIFERRRDLFTGLDLVFFDTTSLYFEGEGGEMIGQYGYSKDKRPDLKQMIAGVVLAPKVAAARCFRRLESRCLHPSGCREYRPLQMPKCSAKHKPSARGLVDKMKILEANCRSWLKRIVVYKLQEKKYGGLSQTAKDKADALIKKHDPVNNKSAKD